MARDWSALSAMRVQRDDALFLDRLRLVKTPWFGVYLHLIHRPDVDPDPHDHPWFFASIVLSGSYEESLWPDAADRSRYVFRAHRRFRPMPVRRKAAHAITDVHGCLWTLVITGPDHDDWRFWTPAGPVPWREYLSREVPLDADD
jgi:hypothetical protein